MDNVVSCRRRSPFYLTVSYAYMHSICVSFGSSLYSCHRLFARLLLQEEFRGLLAHLELKREEILVHGGTRREALAREEI